jgi:hypothetical protein
MSLIDQKIDLHLNQLDPNDFDIVRLPPRYSEADEENRKVILEALKQLEEDFRKYAKPYLDQLAGIEERYQPRSMLVKKTTA